MRYSAPVTRVRVLLVDDQALFREGLHTLLDAHDEIEVVGEAADGEQALRLVAQLKPDVVLMDLRMPVLDGVEATRRLVEARARCAVIALTTFDDDDLLFAALRAGAVGYLLKDVTSRMLVDAIEAAACGQALLQPSIATKVIAELTRLSKDRPHLEAFERLSEREVEVLRWLGRGASNKEIASALRITEGTVKNHVTSIFSKLEVDDRTRAALKARDFGLT